MRDYYLMFRNKPSAQEADRSILERTDDSHRENRFAKTRHTVHMIATICERHREIEYHPLDDQDPDILRIVDLLAADMQTETVEYEGHLWHRAGPLEDEAMGLLETVVFASFMYLLPVIEVDYRD